MAANGEQKILAPFAFPGVGALPAARRLIVGIGYHHARFGLDAVERGKYRFEIIACTVGLVNLNETDISQRVLLPLK